MSFWFQVKGKTKSAALAEVEVKMAEVVKNQPVHSRDSAQVLEVSKLYLGLIDDPEEGEEVTMNVSGSLGWRGNEEKFTSANVGVSAYVMRQS